MSLLNCHSKQRYFIDYFFEQKQQMYCHPDLAWQGVPSGRNRVKTEA